MVLQVSCTQAERPPSLSPTHNPCPFQIHLACPNSSYKPRISHNPMGRLCKYQSTSFQIRTSFAKSKVATDESTPPDIPTVTSSTSSATVGMLEKCINYLYLLSLVHFWGLQLSVGENVDG